MPVVVNVRDVVKDCSVGDKLTGVKGRLKAIFKLSQFGKGEKAGTIQNGFLKDLETDAEIKIKVWNREDLTDKKGEEIVFLARNSTKGMSGLKIVEDEYDGKVQLVIDVSEKAELMVNDGPPAVEDEPEEEGARPAARPAASQSTNRAASRPTAAPAARPVSSKPTWTSVGGQLSRVGSLYAACIIEVVNRVAPRVSEKTGMLLDPDTVHASATTIMLSLLRDRDKLGVLPDLPWKGYLGTEAVPVARPEPPKPKSEPIAEPADITEEDADDDDVPF